MDELLYLYGIALKGETEESPFGDISGIDGKNKLTTISYGDCSAIVSSVAENEFGEEVLKQKTNQMDWVQEKAFLHHEILMSLKEHLTLIPMKFCTIFQSVASLEQKMSSHKKEWVNLLHKLKGKEEWNVKIYSDPELLKEQVADHHPAIQAKREEISQMSKGMQYLQRKKLDQFIDDQVVKEQHSFSKQLHSEWQTLCEDSVTKKIWNKSVTGKEEEMCWNSAYLIDKQNVEDFLEKVTVTNEQGKAAGWKLEVTGPWPVYHFSTLSQSEV